MNGKSILSAMGRHTPEHSSVMSTAGSVATTSPCSSRSSSQRSGAGAHTPGGPSRSPCTQVKTSEGCSNALTPNAAPARSPVSPKLSPGEFSYTQTRPTVEVGSGSSTDDNQSIDQSNFIYIAPFKLIKAFKKRETKHFSFSCQQ